MKTFVKNDTGKDAYGLGLSTLEHKGFAAYGHSGGGIGAWCGLYYFPDKGVYMFLEANLGVVIDGPLSTKAGQMQSEVADVLLDIN